MSWSWYLLAASVGALVIVLFVGSALRNYAKKVWSAVQGGGGTGSPPPAARPAGAPAPTTPPVPFNWDKEGWWLRLLAALCEIAIVGYLLLPQLAPGWSNSLHFRGAVDVMAWIFAIAIPFFLIGEGTKWSFFKGEQKFWLFAGIVGAELAGMYFLVWHVEGFPRLPKVVTGSLVVFAIVGTAYAVFHDPAKPKKKGLTVGKVIATIVVAIAVSAAWQNLANPARAEAETVAPTPPATQTTQIVVMKDDATEITLQPGETCKVRFTKDRKLHYNQDGRVHYSGILSEGKVEKLGEVKAGGKFRGVPSEKLEGFVLQSLDIRPVTVTLYYH